MTVRMKVWNVRGLRTGLESSHTKRRVAAGIVVAVLAIVVAACAPPPPLGTVNQQTPQGPIWPVLADPSVLTANGQYYVFGSNTDAMHVPLHIVTSLTQTYTIPEWDAIVHDAMPSLPSWAVNNAVWAPSVARFGSTYVMFFAANRVNAPDPANTQCIGRATSAVPQGPYTPEATPYSCGIEGVGGALDPQIFIGPHGNGVLYAAFSNTEKPIYLMLLDANGNNQRGPNGLAGYWPFPVLGKKYGWEGAFIENPAMVYDASTKSYVVAYSAGDWASGSYSTGLARCSLPSGLCAQSATGPWLASGNGRTGTGGLSFFTAVDGSLKAVYASFTGNNIGPFAIRGGTVASVSLGDAPTLGP
jgi:Glycosyl hydrolases family 43